MIQSIKRLTTAPLMTHLLGVGWGGGVQCRVTISSLPPFPPGHVGVRSKSPEHSLATNLVDKGHRKARKLQRVVTQTQDGPDVTAL